MYLYVQIQRQTHTDTREREKCWHIKSTKYAYFISSYSESAIFGYVCQGGITPHKNGFALAQFEKPPEDTPFSMIPLTCCRRRAIQQQHNSSSKLAAVLAFSISVSLCVLQMHLIFYIYIQRQISLHTHGFIETFQSIRK